MNKLVFLISAQIYNKNMVFSHGFAEYYIFSELCTLGVPLAEHEVQQAVTPFISISKIHNGISKEQSPSSNTLSPLF